VVQPVFADADGGDHLHVLEDDLSHGRQHGFESRA
jgi:hypothetical protein